MTEITCPQEHVKEAGETVNVLLSFLDLLDKDASINETITSVSSVTGSPSGLTITGGAATTVARKVNGVNVPAAKAITFTVAGGSNASDYTITATVVTSGGQTRKRLMTLLVRAA